MPSIAQTRPRAGFANVPFVRIPSSPFCFGWRLVTPARCPPLFDVAFLLLVEAEDLARLLRRCNVTAVPLRDLHHALDEHSVVLGEFARRDVRVVFVTDANMAAERN